MEMGAPMHGGEALSCVDLPPTESRRTEDEGLLRPPLLLLLPIAAWIASGVLDRDACDARRLMS
jgi:hypothetical protein